MADDWDLHAVVKGCATVTTTAYTTPPTASSQNFQNQFSGFPPIFSIPNPFEPKNVIEDLDELFKPFPPQSSNISSFNSIFGSNEEAKLNQKIKKHPASISNPNPSRSKRRKNQMKRICEVPAEGLSSDMWAWRKYGQKPIKGSPYPRGYYRCSSSKGCLARKMVERNRSDPNMFIVTYTAEHNHPAPTHRNSLAGSSRQKALTSQIAPTAGESPATSVEEEVVKLEDEEDYDLGISDVVIGDEFFEGLEELVDSPVAGDCISDQFPANFGFPWIANNATSAASSI